jgi:hypothetical protein
MASPNDFMTGVKLTAGPVNQNGTIAIMNLPGVGADTTIDQSKAEVAANGQVYVAPMVQVTLGPDFINVTNKTGQPWPQHSEVYVCAPRFPPADPSAQIEALEAKVTALEGQVGALEATVADHETRIAALEAAAPI